MVTWISNMDGRMRKFKIFEIVDGARCSFRNFS